MRLLVLSFGMISLSLAQTPQPQPVQPQPAQPQPEQPQPAPKKWEKEIAAIEKRLKESPPPKGGVFFAGSSSIKLWKLEKSFPEAGYVNVGFGGSIIPDTTHYADRILLPYEPATIVFYAGDNDIAAKRTPEQVRDDFQAFVKVIHEKLPKTRILFLGIKPSPKRWALFSQQSKANADIKAFIDGDTRLSYLDTVPIMLGKDGKPDPGLFLNDELHLNEKGYQLWTDLVKKHLK